MHREEGGRWHLLGRTPKEVWGFALHPLTLHDDEWELDLAAEPDTAAFPSPVLVAVTPAGAPIPWGTQAGGCCCSSCGTKEVLVWLQLPLMARGCSRAASLVSGPLCPSKGLWPGCSGRLPSPQEGVGPGALPAPLAPAARQREEPSEIPLAAAQSPPEPAWRHQGEPDQRGHGSGLVGLQHALRPSHPVVPGWPGTPVIAA